MCSERGLTHKVLAKKFVRLDLQTHNDEIILELLQNLEIGNNMFCDFQFYLK